MAPSWLQLSVKAAPAALDILSNFLLEQGSPGVVLKRDEVQAFFRHRAARSRLEKDIQRFLGGIKAIYPAIGEPELRWTVLKDKDWADSWRRFFTPQKVGKSLWITPPWVAPPESTGRRIVTIEPGMAFGTGTHPTTRCCLEFVEEAVYFWNEKKVRALDVGTGSGVLAIALAKMGAHEVWAIDNDPLALRAAQSNVRRNRVEERVKLSSSALSRLKRSFAVVVANLTAETIMELSKELQRRVAPGGHLILSGILKPKAVEVLRRFTPGPFILSRRKNDKEWATLLLRKKGWVICPASL